MRLEQGEEEDETGGLENIPTSSSEEKGDDGVFNLKEDEVNNKHALTLNTTEIKCFFSLSI